MSKRKMCGCFQYCSYDGVKKDSGCPKNTNARCEIITRKPRMVKVKGWAGHITNENGYKGWAFIEQGIGVLAFPAELFIKTKYLKGGRK